MSTQGKNIYVDDMVLAALEAAAQRESKSVDEIAAKAVMAGLGIDRKARLERLFERGEQIAAQHPDMPGPDEIAKVVRLARLERSTHSR